MLVMPRHRLKAGVDGALLAITHLVHGRLHVVVDATLGPRGADAGTIAIMCGGPAEAYTKVLPMALMVKDLKLAAQMASGCGAPMLIANTVRNLFEVGANQLGGTGKLDDMARFFEAMSAIKFQAD